MRQWKEKLDMTLAYCCWHVAENWKGKTSNACLAKNLFWVQNALAFFPSPKEILVRKYVTKPKHRNPISPDVIKTEEFIKPEKSTIKQLALLLIRQLLSWLWNLFKWSFNRRRRRNTAFNYYLAVFIHEQRRRRSTERETTHTTLFVAEVENTTRPTRNATIPGWKRLTVSVDNWVTQHGLWDENHVIEKSNIWFPAVLSEV